MRLNLDWVIGRMIARHLSGSATKPSVACAVLSSSVLRDIDRIYVVQFQGLKQSVVRTQLRGAAKEESGTIKRSGFRLNFEAGLLL